MVSPHDSSTLTEPLELSWQMVGAVNITHLAAMALSITQSFPTFLHNLRWSHGASSIQAGNTSRPTDEW